MAIGAYLAVGLAVYLFSVAVLVSGTGLVRYSKLAFPLLLGGLLIWVGLSNLLGVIIFAPGSATSYSLPQDYLARGAWERVATLVGVLGALSPLSAALLLRRQTGADP